MHIINFNSDVEENRASQHEIIKIHRINETPPNNFNKSVPYISDLNPTRVSSLHRIRINKILINNSSRLLTTDIISLVLAAWKMQGRKKLFLLFQTGIAKRPLKTDSKAAIVSEIFHTMYFNTCAFFSSLFHLFFHSLWPSYANIPRTHSDTSI